ncbi:MAG: glycosyltransferase family 2 protein [Dehalococcoidales bacterium]|nr:glycosyltransferase family 2 protein [Dehalococcoidales bacterium]
MESSCHSSQENKPKIIAVMPAFNEAKYIGTIALEARQYVDEVIIVDDGSTDQTAHVARLAGATVIRHQENMGYGASIQDLLAEAKRRDFDVLVLLDADSQHNPNEIPGLIRPITAEGFDFVIGSREQERANIPAYRHIGQRAIAYFSRILSGEKLYDSESGFRAFSRKAITLLELKENGMAISAETIAKAAQSGLKITERPISIRYTADGSTLNPLVHGIEVLGRIIAMISERRPLFFFGLGGSIGIALGFLTGIRVVSMTSTSGVMPVGTALLAILLIIVGTLSVFTGIILNVLVKR